MEESYNNVLISPLFEMQMKDFVDKNKDMSAYEVQIEINKMVKTAIEKGRDIFCVEKRCCYI